MANITVCVRFRPFISSEKKLHGESTCIQALDAQSFAFQDEKGEDAIFCFDKAFYQDSDQVEVYDFLAMPIIEGALNGINGTILIYGQGPSVLDEDQKKKGLLPRVVDGLFEGMKSFSELTKWTVKLTMVEIYMDKIRDLFDVSKDNIQIKESKCQGIFLSGATEMLITNAAEALRCLHRGIANRAVGETQMNVASSRSHSLYIFSVQQEYVTDGRSKIGKAVLVDLAGSEKTEKTGAVGTLLEEAKSINKSLSALGNVINALTTGKVNHIPYRDSRLTRILQDALGGNSRTGLLCCCSPCLTNASESLSTFRFGARAKLLKSSPRTNNIDAKDDKEQTTDSQIQVYEHAVTILDKMEEITTCQTPVCTYETLLEKLRQNLSDENVDMLERLFKQEGLIFVPRTVEELEAAFQDVREKTISALEQKIEKFRDANIELMRVNHALQAELAIAREVALKVADPVANAPWFHKIMKSFASYVPFI
ncbi:kinesin-like protein KIN-1 isoform X2 [Zingiber officinale]|uniref:kinesin-like protein KIN-1 isoform X2 n=1 Tax=Zingiber officinale TaxID=94328 RepID=UPI001C4D5BEA|nr:kinesin-like protein KIN-1 isoform X2 [Zingiber officinale]